ncbi:aminotransferase class I/II-fold pyridoxal phosphate-dependent enzyme [Aureibaculum conchae]|uniref:aminotransferase class I/II-fold pyridoxal phosphate-dependent enzyme n=1 Tax=Aureibaculum sp. 2308TA14-22 TaxID=3108392 RepID=UPI0033920C11
MIVKNFPDRTIAINGKDYLYFGGTGYLGLATHPEFQRILMKSIQKWGTFYGSSRNSNIKLSVYNQFEDFFAQQIGAEASLTVSSGTLAGRLVIDFLEKTSPVFFHYPKTHPAILAKSSLPLFDGVHLNARLLNDKKEDIVITVDAVSGREVKPTVMDFLDKISPQKKITLVVDESHSLGVTGKNGNGIFKTIKHPVILNKIMVCSLGKALGLSGGSIAGTRKFIDALKGESVFISSSAANPAYLQTYLDAQDIYARQRQKLNKNLAYITAHLKNKNIIADKNYPAMYIENDAAYDLFLNEGIVITSFNYPTYKKKMNRIVITANHTDKDLEQLVNILNTKM